MASTGSVCDTDTKLWLHLDGADAGVLFPDVSASPHDAPTNPSNGVVTSVTAPKLGSAAAYCDGGAGHGLYWGDHADWDFGTGPFTVDFWFKFAELPGDFKFIHRNTGLMFGIGGHTTTGGLYIYVAGNTHDLGAVVTYDNTTWHHFACTRDASGDVRAFIDGVQVGSTFTDAGDCTSSDRLQMFLNQNNTSSIECRIDEFRWVKGTAVWVANFTPPTVAYTLPTFIKKVAGVAYAAVKKICSVAIASIEKCSGVD